MDLWELCYYHRLAAIDGSIIYNDDFMRNILDGGIYGIQTVSQTIFGIVGNYDNGKIQLFFPGSG